jgi:two-component system, sensor histidine kinase RegB
VVVLALFHLPLPWTDQSFALAPLFIFGLASALGLSVVFIAGYVFSVAEEARRMSGALSASYLALDREQRVSALGALAAAAAHRLGSPLGTIAVVAKELARDLPADSPHRADVELLLSESERCRTILTELSTRPETGEPLQRMPLAALIETAAAPYRVERVRLIIDAGPEADSPSRPAPQAPHSPELVHGLGNLLQNAIEFAHSEVRVTVRWSDRRISLKIRDDGPGFAPGLLDHLGEPYLSGGENQGRIGTGEPMGLGVFIAQTLLGRTGAQLSFGNGQDGGAEVTIAWSRAALESEPSPA